LTLIDDLCIHNFAFCFAWFVRVGLIGGLDFGSGSATTHLLGRVVELGHGFFQLSGGSFDGIEVIGLQRITHGEHFALEIGLEFGRSFIAQFFELFLDLEGKVFCLILRIDSLDALTIFLGVSLGFLASALDFVFAETGRSLDGNFFAPCRIVCLSLKRAGCRWRRCRR